MKKFLLLWLASVSLQAVPVVGVRVLNTLADVMRVRTPDNSEYRIEPGGTILVSPHTWDLTICYSNRATLATVSTDTLPDNCVVEVVIYNSATYSGFSDTWTEEPHVKYRIDAGPGDPWRWYLAGAGVGAVCLAFAMQARFTKQLVGGGDALGD